MTIKKQLFQEIESTPEELLEETLDFLRFLKTKQNLEKPKATEFQQSYRPASGRSILRHAGKWSGNDLEECLRAVYATRGKAKFDYDLNPFE
ncbi:MAG: hypothetical protein RLZZ574_2003 [Cyanobacteriota bacterium]|jgi:hypothetical protein